MNQIWLKVQQLFLNNNYFIQKVARWDLGNLSENDFGNEVLAICLRSLNSRLPLKHGSDRPQTLPKRVSDDPQHFIFRRRTNFFVGIFRSWTSFSLVFVKFLGSWDFMPVKFKFLAIFCFRWTCYHLCTTQKRQKYACLRCQNHGVGTGTLGYRYLGAPLIGQHHSNVSTWIQCWIQQVVTPGVPQLVGSNNLGAWGSVHVMYFTV